MGRTYWAIKDGRDRFVWEEDWYDKRGGFIRVYRRKKDAELENLDESALESGYRAAKVEIVEEDKGDD